MTEEKLFRLIEENKRVIAQAAPAYFSASEPLLERIYDSMQYSFASGGKRVRSFLVRNTCRTLGGDECAALSAALAVEMVHTYSLIHDDLPCMDNDDLRRGKPTNHKVFGEAVALLAGDALLTEAFRVIAEDQTLDDAVRVALITALSRASGACGMIGGQLIDLQSEGKRIPLETLRKMHALKTGELIKAACIMGCICAGYGEDTQQYRAVSEYACGIGVVFQIIDDILDVTSTTERLGKTVGSDEQNEKNTYMSFFTVDQARETARSMTESAIATISPYDTDGALSCFARYLLEREL